MGLRRAMAVFGRNVFLSRLVRAPAAHFAIFGGVLFAVYSWRPPEPPSAGWREQPEIVFTSEDVGRLRQDWAQQYGRDPGPKEEESLIEQAIEEEILHREALALGLDRGDRVVEARLRWLGRSVSNDPDLDDAASAREARGLGLERSDLIIRRYLVRMMQLFLAKPHAADMPSEIELRAYLDQHAERFAQPARTRLTHVFFSSDRRGAAAERQAADLLAELRRGSTSPERAAERGDPFVLGSPSLLATSAQLDRTFGPGFSQSVGDIDSGRWGGPLRSSYGWHLVRVDQRIPGHPPAMETVRSRLLHRFLRERGRERLRSNVAVLRTRYQITRAYAAASDRGEMRAASAESAPEPLLDPRLAAGVGDDQCAFELSAQQ